MNTQMNYTEKGLNDPDIHDGVVDRREKVEAMIFFCLGPKITVEKAMATHSSTLAWKIPWTEEPGRL